MRTILKTFILAAALSLAACENGAYDTGDGALSAMRADFVEAHTDAEARMVSVETDGGERLPLTSPVAVAWMERPDTTYRALLYYNKVTAASGSPAAQPVTLKQVLVPRVVSAAALKGGAKTDPVTFVSSWTGANGKYLNLELLVKVGQVDGGYGSQTIGIVCDSIVATPGDSRRRVHLSLYHDQNNVPEYYSTEAYVSIPVTGLPINPAVGDEVIVRLNTYDGIITRTFEF